MPALPTEVAEIRDRVLSWLRESEFPTVREIGARPLLWGFKAYPASGLPILVAQESKDRDVVEIRFEFNISVADAQILGALEDVEKARLKTDFWKFLGQTPVAFNITFAEGGSPDRIQLSSRIAYDGLTKDRFLQAIRSLQNAFVVAGAVITDYLKAAPSFETRPPGDLN